MKKFLSICIFVVFSTLIVLNYVLAEEKNGKIKETIEKVKEKLDDDSQEKKSLKEAIDNLGKKGKKKRPIKDAIEELGDGKGKKPIKKAIIKKRIEKKLDLTK